MSFTAVLCLQYNMNCSAVAVLVNSGVTTPSSLPSLDGRHRTGLKPPCLGGMEGEKAGLELGPQLEDPPG